MFLGLTAGGFMPDSVAKERDDWQKLRRANRPPIPGKKLMTPGCMFIIVLSPERCGYAVPVRALLMPGLPAFLADYFVALDEPKSPVRRAITELDPDVCRGT